MNISINSKMSPLIIEDFDEQDEPTSWVSLLPPQVQTPSAKRCADVASGFIPFQPPEVSVSSISPNIAGRIHSFCQPIGRFGGNYSLGFLGESGKATSSKVGSSSAVVPNSEGAKFRYARFKSFVLDELLKPHQRDAVKLIKTQKKVLLAYGMGLGKTRLALYIPIKKHTLCYCLMVF